MVISTMNTYSEVMSEKLHYGERSEVLMRLIYQINDMASFHTAC